MHASSVLLNKDTQHAFIYFFFLGCEIVASNIFFDDNTCGNIYKYLKVCYECMPDEANAVDVLLDKKRRRKKKKKRGKQLPSQYFLFLFRETNLF